MPGMKSSALLAIERLELLRVQAVASVPPTPPRARVRVAMSLKGCTQRELADAVGINEGLLSSVLSGRRTLSQAQAEAIGDFLGVPAEVLFPTVAA